MNKKIITVVSVIVAAILVSTFVYLEVDHNSISWTKGFGIEVEILDPSFHVVGVNHTVIHRLGFENYTATNKSISIQLPKTWNTVSDAYAFALYNTLNYTIPLTLSDNFSNNVVFMYYTLNFSQNLDTHNITHQINVEITWRQNGTDNYTNQLYSANTTNDGQAMANLNHSKPNYTYVTSTLVGDGYIIQHRGIISVQAHQYVYMTVGNYNFTGLSYYPHGNYTYDGSVLGVLNQSISHTYMTGKLSI